MGASNPSVRKGRGMASVDVAGELAEFADILKLKEPPAPFTLFKIGGPAEVMVEPPGQGTGRGRQAAVRGIQLRILGAGCSVWSTTTACPARAALNRLLHRHRRPGPAHSRRRSATAPSSPRRRRALTGLEHLVGMPGSVGALSVSMRRSRCRSASSCRRWRSSTARLRADPRQRSAALVPHQQPRRAGALDRGLRAGDRRQLTLSSQPLRKAWIHQGQPSLQLPGTTHVFKNRSA